MTLPSVPTTVADLDPDKVIEVLRRNLINVTASAEELGVAPADLRRLLWSRPRLTEAAVEMEEFRIDKAEQNIHEALTSDDSRRRDAASFFVVRNSARAKRRGWITSASAGVEVNVGGQNENIIFQWRTTPIEVRDPVELARRRAIDDAREALAVAEGKRVVTIGWGDPPDKDVNCGQVIEHDSGEG